jgi:hypothetical protein
MLTATIITVTWNETYKANMGDTRLVSKGERTFRRQADADKFVTELQSPETIEFSMFAGRENRIENIQVK